MNKLKISILQILIIGSLLFNAEVSFSADAHNKNSTIPQIAVGTFVYYSSIEQPMLLNNHKNGSWSFVNTIENVENGGYLYNVNCTNQICIATGAIETELYYGRINHRNPLFIISHDNGQSWSTINKISGLPAMRDGIAPNISCINHICTAVGWYEPIGYSFPLLLSSNDDGQSWSYVHNIAHLPAMKDGALYAITCIENFCIAGGTYDIQKDDNHLLFLKSNDSGQSWSFVPNIIDPPKINTADLKAIKCNDNVCVAAGTYDYTHALLLVSKDRGQSWVFVKDIPDLSNLKDISIKDLTYTNGAFIAVGGYHKSEETGFLQSLILISNDNGQSWSLVKRIDGSPSNKAGRLKSISCSANACVAGGDEFYNSGFNFGLTLLVSQDNGQSWKLTPYVSGTTHTPDIDVVQCSDNYCTAIGHYTDGVEYSHPAVLISADKGIAWSIAKDILNFPKYTYKVHFSSMIIAK